MPAYDASRYDPPAPVVTVTLRASTGGPSVPNVSLLLDTGADVTLLPASAVQQLGLAPAAGVAYDLVGFDGSRSTAGAVDLDMLFLGKAFRGRYLLTNEDHGVLGRDVLASVAIHFDRPRHEWSQK
jgi:Aspartyl protease